MNLKDTLNYKQYYSEMSVNTIIYQIIENNITYDVIEYGVVKYWYKNDKLHRENGPAIEYFDGSKYWYIN